jgi:hypothetical protein
LALGNRRVKEVNIIIEEVRIDVRKALKELQKQREAQI